MQGFGSDPPRFFAGQMPNGDPVFHYQGFTVGFDGAIDITQDAMAFRRLCPASFVGPPAENLKRINFADGCKTMLPDAEETVVSAGLNHVMNFKVIDAWNIHEESATWFTKSCSANVTLNSGGDRLLKYRLVPKHGRYFVQAKFE